MELWFILTIIILGVSVLIGLFLMFGGNKYRRRNYAAELYTKMAKEESKDHAPKNEHIVVKEDPVKEYVNSFSIGRLISKLVIFGIPVIVFINISGVIKDEICNANTYVNITTQGYDTFCGALSMAGSSAMLAVICIIAIGGIVFSFLGSFGDSVEVNSEKETEDKEDDYY